MKVLCSYNRTACMGFHNGECRSIENCGGKVDIDLRYKLIEYLYEINTNADYKIEEIADDIIDLMEDDT